MSRLVFAHMILTRCRETFWLALIAATLCCALFLQGENVVAGEETQELDKSQMARVTFSDSEENEPHWPDTTLEKRFANYWFLRFQGSVEQGFALEAPHVKELIPLRKYRMYVQGAALNKLIEVRVLKIRKLSDHLIEVPLRLHFLDKGGKATTTDRVDRWVRVDGQWYHVLRNKVLFPHIS